MECVLVTGASGYVGLHCVAQLLTQGYLVKGTVRSLSRAAEIRNSLSNASICHKNLSLIKADLTEDTGWKDAVENCDYVLHVASPFFIGEPKDPNHWINIASAGTLRIMRAASTAGVKKLVLTSSCGAITENRGGLELFSEDDWTDPTLARVSTYFKSKTIAERAAWQFSLSGDKHSKMALAVINPSMIVGPSLSDDIGVSNGIIKRMIDGSTPATIALHFGFVDVRDVAKAHVLALKNTRSNGERIIVSEREMWLKDVAKILRDNGYNKAPKIELPNFLAKLFGVFNTEIRSTTKILGQRRITTANKAKNILDWSPRDVRDSILESARQITELEKPSTTTRSTLRTGAK